MEIVRGIADAFEHLLYETLGLLLPGLSVLLLGGAIWLPQVDAARFLASLESHQLLVLMSAYVVGYAVQGVAQWGARLPRGLTLDGAAVFAAARRPFQQRAHDYWARALCVDPAESLSAPEVRDLSYSVLGAATKRLERFRAAEGLTRGVATVSLAGLLIIGLQVALRLREPSPTVALASVGLLVSASALFERALRYARLWETVLESQFAATVLASAGVRSAAPATAISVSPAQDGAVHIAPSSDTRSPISVHHTAQSINEHR